MGKSDTTGDLGGSESAVTAWSPLRNGRFGMLWLAWLTANMCMVMSEVAAAWIMTTLSDQTLLVALVQTAATLPVFLLVLPSGALADVFDRRIWLLGTQFWLFVITVALALFSYAGILSVPLLLLLVFASGVGWAMRWPAFVAIVPEVVSRAELPQALALHGMAMNGSRVIGPLVAGLLLAILGSTFVFALCAVLSLGAALVLLRWRYVPAPREAPREHLVVAMMSAAKYVTQSTQMRIAMGHIFVACMQVFALVALLPALANQMEGEGAMAYSILLSFMGMGAVLVGLGMPRLRGRIAANTVLTSALLLHVVSVFIMALATTPWVAAPAMFLAGAAWLAIGNTINVSAHLALPDNVRARGMAIFMMAAMAGSALGAALYGAVADGMGVGGSLWLLGVAGLCFLFLMRRWRISD